MSQQKVGVGLLVSLVMGNMIGTGIFLLPASIASLKWMGFIGWIVSAIGIFFIAKVFSMLSKKYPLAGGPYAYTKKELGSFISFFSSWGYWIAIWSGLSAIAVGFVSYVGYFFPSVNSNPIVFTSTCIISIWILVLVNMKGIKESSWVQFITTVLKLIPLFFIGILGMFFIKMENLTSFSFSNDFSFSTLNSSVALTVFAFLGIESATVPANHIKNPERSISKATMIAIIFTSILYLLCSITLTGILSFSVLEKSKTPFADAAILLWGKQAANWIAAGAVISGFGCLNGWILLMGQVPQAMAKDHLMPKIFLVENKFQVPAKGLIVGAILASLVLLLNLNKSLLETYNYLILLATVSNIIPYLLSSVALFVMLKKTKPNNLYWKYGIAIIAFLFSAYVIYSTGKDALIWIGVLLLISILFFKIMNFKYGSSKL